MDDLRVGVIGVCQRGTLADLAHRPGGGSRLVAGADPWPSALAEFDRRLGGGMGLHADWRALLDRRDVDAVFVTAPDHLHEEMVSAALEAGKAVYAEKPLAITLEGCDRILRTARATGSRLYVGHNMRHMPVVLKMREIIESGAIGRVQAVWCRHFINYGGDAYFRDWHSERRFTGGLLLQKGAHDIDVIHWLAGARTDWVSGMGRLSVYDRCARRQAPRTERFSARFDDAHWPPLALEDVSPDVDVEDHSMVMMQLANGAQASYLQCHYTPDAERNYTFIGDRGRLENEGDWGSCEVRVWTRRGARRDPDIVHRLKPEPGGHGGADTGVVQGFLDFVREGKPPLTSPVAARDAVAVGVLGHASMRGDGARLRVPPPEAEVAAYFGRGQARA